MSHKLEVGERRSLASHYTLTTDARPFRSEKFLHSLSIHIAIVFLADTRQLVHDVCLEVRGKVIRTVLKNSSLDWVLSHWDHFTVCRFICVCVFVFFHTACLTRWGRPDGIEAWSLLPYLPSVL